MLKLLFNIFIIYALWQIIKMFFAVKKVQTTFQRDMSDLHEKMNNSAGQTNTNKTKGPSKGPNPLDTEGEYVDYEEIK